MKPLSFRKYSGKPPWETKRGSKNRIAREIGGKITVFNCGKRLLATRELSEAERSRRVFVGRALNFRVRMLLKGAVVFLSRKRSSKRLFSDPPQKQKPWS